MFELPKLPYAYDALEPHYDKETLEIHHKKHHNAYTQKFNAAVENANLTGKTVEEILMNLDTVPEEKREALRNHGGGYWNHTFFWESMSPNGGGKATAVVGDAIKDVFGSFDTFQEQFTAKAAGHFGSGWAWLVLENNQLKITDTHNQVCPLSLGQKPLLTIDVWEHAYYLKFKNVRPDWIKSWWNIVNWKKVNERYLSASC